MNETLFYVASGLLVASGTFYIRKVFFTSQSKALVSKATNDGKVVTIGDNNSGININQ